MGAPVGVHVRINYDAALGVVIEPGEALVTATGRTYLILGAKKVGGRNPNRWRLRCEVTDGPPPRGVFVHTLRWYSRERGLRPGDHRRRASL